jgi:hypothetical protein
MSEKVKADYEISKIQDEEWEIEYGWIITE